MKKIEKVKGEDYEIISSNDKCVECRFQCKVIVTSMKQMNISCKHPKGPGNPDHCIYFKSMEI
ncbi:MAG: hypothetical protein HZC47_10540 [Methanobacterium sp.]|uniref:hypothetical protein n=1 Tax=Methanobacterium sp. TaxID=2164 RepID=UPI003D6506F5|nr:hypothetical protein [Methanobacterium sp.]